MSEYWDVQAINISRSVPYILKPFDAPFGASICSNVIEELKKYLPGYQKGDQDIFNKIQDRLDNAITNAHRVKQYHQTSGTGNPSTCMHSLVEYLRDLKKE